MVKLSQVTVNWILNSQGMVSFMITTGSLNNQDMTMILKQWRHDFSGKHLRNRYCMDIIWCLCGSQNSWFCKASLRICCKSLFECKGLWILKTAICGTEDYKTGRKKYHVQYCEIIFILLCSIFSRFLIFFMYIINIGFIRKILVCNFHF